jgi:hypothetical protein
MFTTDKAERRAHNMCEMMERLGLDARITTDDARDAWLSGAVRACQACDVDILCRDWLARAPKCIEGAPAFCPNAERFALLREDAAA